MASSQDTEITLGTGKMVVIFFGLVALCAVFFAIGFKLGKDSVVSAPAAQAATTVVGGPRPSAAKSGASSAPAANVSPTSQNTTQSADAPPTSAAVATDPSAPGADYFVQVAAVSKQEDADALVEALKKKQYPAQSTSSGDKLFHVQVGPFADIKEAESTRAKLVNDGYNPILKK